jgi:predicted nucleotidyltransferase
MVDVIQSKLIAIKGACARAGVVRLYAFGSVLRDDFSPKQSDIDFLVDFGDMHSYNRKAAYFALYDELCTIFDTSHIDLVMTGAIKNPYILQAIDKDKEILYAA